jgi:hypothetical protein
MVVTVRPTLDREHEPWSAVFPGLGTVRIGADGSIDVEVEQDHRDEPEDPALREAALRFGWGEPLSFVRRGFRCAWGTALVPPEGIGCLIVNGSIHDVSIILVELVAAGWSVLSDRFVPTTWHEGELLGHPRDAPVLISRRRARRNELHGFPVRNNSDAVAIEPPRTREPQRVRAFVEVGIRRPDEPVLEELHGHDRFSAASLAMIGGVMAGVGSGSDELTPQEVMQNHLALSALRQARLRFRSDTLEVDVAELCQWWSICVATGSEHS